MGRKAKIPKRHRKRWTKEEESYLWGTWLEKSPVSIARRLERKPYAIKKKAENMGLPCRGKQGFFSLRDLEKKLGYNGEAIKIAAVRAGIVLDSRRIPLIGRGLRRFRKAHYFGFSFEDVDLITVELFCATNPNLIRRTKKGEWGTGKKPDVCILCGTKNRPHEQQGLCKRCVMKEQRRGRQGRYPNIVRPATKSDFRP